MSSRLLKKTHMLRCTKSPRCNVLAKYASAHRFFARLASEIFLSSLLDIQAGLTLIPKPRSYEYVTQGGQEITNTDVSIKIKKGSIDARKIVGCNDPVFPE